MLLHPAWRSIFKRAAPLVKLMDVRSDTTDLTTYTFTACNVGDFGTNKTPDGDVYGTNPHLRSPGNKLIAVIVHGEDAATTFNVSSVTIGGAAGTERVDRAGATNAINTAIYTWSSFALQNITNTDIVVTWSEAVSCCAIGVLSVENLGVAQFVSNHSVTATGDLVTTISSSLTGFDTYALCIGGATCSGVETFATGVYADTAGVGNIRPTILYDESNAEIAFAGFWTYMPAYPAGNNPFQIISAWSGTGAGDQVIAAFV